MYSIIYISFVLWPVYIMYWVIHNNFNYYASKFYALYDYDRQTTLLKILPSSYRENFFYGL